MNINKSVILKKIISIKYLTLFVMLTTLFGCSKSEDTANPATDTNKCIVTQIDGTFFGGSFTLNFLYDTQKRIIRTGLPGDDLSKVSYFLIKNNAAGQISKILDVNRGGSADTA